MQTVFCYNARAMNKLQLFNTETGKKKVFSPIKNKVGIYVCGITPYDVTHLGHAFLYTSFDVVVRYLRYLGYTVTYVQNITDIDDDILKKAKEMKKNWRVLGEENAQNFLSDQKWLNNVVPDYMPRATDYIPEMIVIIQKLIKKGFAYESGQSVYFSVKKDKEYGKLSKLSRKKMFLIANERGNNPDDKNKRDPLDFILWQATKKGEPSWTSPWGLGRPGWHIECSAMSGKLLGNTVDIHGGGSDLIFPHHESEIAQSEHANGKPFVRFWMHTGMLKYKGEKMSKSLGNMVFIEDLKKKHSANVIRVFLLSHHYRAVCECFEDAMGGATATTELLKDVFKRQSGQGKVLSVALYEKRFFEFLNDDINTPKAIRTLEELSNKILREKKDTNITQAKAFMETALHILGLEMERA